MYLPFFLISIIIPFTLSTLCKDDEFNKILSNSLSYYFVGPDIEACYEYTLVTDKEKLSFVFGESDSLTGEIILYKSLSDISIKNNMYQNYVDRFLISENGIKEVDLDEYDENIYIIIRDTNFSSIYMSNFTIYDTQVPITMSEGTPITMKHFLSNDVYHFTYLSSNSINLVYSAKVKSKKYITVLYDGDIITQKRIDDTDQVFYFKSNTTDDKLLNVLIEDIQKGVEDEEFSIVVYEKEYVEFLELSDFEIIKLNYINLNCGDEKQTFYYYYLMGNSTQVNTINFKLDPKNNVTNYINIVSGLHHSSKKLKEGDFEKLFNLEKNKFPVAYDLGSDEYKKIYFYDNDTSYPYRYLYFKIEISKLEEYYSPKDILITIGDEVEVINLTGLIDYHAEEIKREVYPFVPTYFKLILNPNDTYLFVSPYPENTIYVEGDLINIDKNNNIEINRDYYMDPDGMFMLFDSDEVTIAIFGSEPYLATFYVEKYNSSDMPVSEYIRDEDPIDITFTQNDCLTGRKKFILGIYNKEDYDENSQTIVKYWTSKEGGDFNVYYRNNITLEGDSLLPCDEKYKQKKEFTIQVSGYYDFFTITCNKPGIFYLRSPYLVFDELTYKIGQNSYNKLEIEYDVNIIQLTAPMRPTVNYLYFALYSTEGKKIKIAPDTPELFNETVIEGDNVFKLKVDLYKFKSDELAIRVNSTGDANIEAVEVIQYNYTEFTILDKEVWRHITDNQFVKFINRKTKKINVGIKGLKDVTINYALVKVFTDDADYLPMAYRFKDFVKVIKCKENEEIEIENPYFGDKDDNKKYLALIVSIPQAKYFEFEAIVYEDFSKKIPWLIILLVAASIILVALIIFIIICLVKHKKTDVKKLEMDAENNGNEPLDQENRYKGINDS